MQTAKTSTAQGRWIFLLGLASLVIGAMVGGKFFFGESASPGSSDRVEPISPASTREPGTYQQEHKIEADKLEPPTRVDSDPNEEAAIKTEARQIYEKALREERRRLAKEKEEKVMAPPANANRVAAPNDTLEMVQRSLAQSQAQAAQAYMLVAKTKVDQENSGEAPFQDAVKVEKEAEVAHAANNFEAAGRLYRLAEAQYLKAAQAAQEKTRKLLQENDRQEAVQREVRSLIDSYKNAFENRDLQGLRTFFESGFRTEDEKAWAKFFQTVQDIKANVTGENIQIGKDNVEVNLAVFIDYANHKGRRQEPLALKESWTLAQRGGRWRVVSRQIQ